jgi:hypothetical protein
LRAIHLQFVRVAVAVVVMLRVLSKGSCSARNPAHSPTTRASVVAGESRGESIGFSPCRQLRGALVFIPSISQ